MKPTLLLLLLVTAVSAQYPTFIGEADPSEVKLTPRHRITVWTGGFDQPHPKWAKKKTFNQCVKYNLPVDQCFAAQDYVRQLTGHNTPSILLEEIDNAADHVREVWNNCGGSYANFINRFDWSRITVIVKDSIFPNPDTGVISGGITTRSGREIWIVNLAFQGWFSYRQSATLATMGAFARWELGNCAIRQYYGRYKDIGDTPPCQ